jgi:hypothetical protein
MSPAAPLPHDLPHADLTPDPVPVTALDAMLGWMGLYIPTWGTSLALHLAVFLVAAFVIISIHEETDAFAINTEAYAPKVYTGQKRPQVSKPKSRGEKKLQESLVAFKPVDVPHSGIGQNPTRSKINVIGVGGGPQGKVQIGLNSDGDPFGPPPGMEEEAYKVVYVCDRSGSMSDSIHLVKSELKRSLWDLNAASEFHVIFFSSGPPVEMPTRRLVSATDRNRTLACEFIDTVTASHETDPSKALERAFAVQPDIIYLLTDGEFDGAVVDHVRRMNVGGKVRVFTIAFMYRAGERVLKAIAAQNEGEYKFVSEADLVASGR